MTNHDYATVITMAKKQKNIASVLLACIGWFAMWSLTQGFYMNPYLQSFVPGPIDVRILLITAYILIVSTIILLFLQSETKKFLTYSRWLWLYLLPLGCIIALPFTYQGPLPVWTFIAMITISVFWQDTLTFGLFQNYVRRSVSGWKTIAIIGTLFGVGHILAFLPDMAQVLHPGFYLLFIAGCSFAWLREKTGNVYIINVLHMTFLLAATITL